MRYIKKFENYNIFSGEYVSNYISEITPDESDIPDYFIEKFINPNDFKLIKLKISELLESDESFAEYLNYGEDRYAHYDEDESPMTDQLYDPVVVVDGIVMDGYNRMTVLKSLGEDNVDAYVNI